MTQRNLGVILIKVFYITALLIYALDARENPFFPSAGEKELFVTSNEETKKEPLKKASLSLPTYARVIQKVTVEFKNLDGTIESKSIELDNSIDWHLPILISQNYAQSQNNGTKKPQETEEEIAVPAQEPKTQDSSFKTIASIKDVTLLASNKTLKILTQDEIIRNFLISDPHRIVMDFKKEIDIKNYTKKDPQIIFKEVRIGSHEGYYRVVVELDGHYRYDFKKVSSGYEIELK